MPFINIKKSFIDITKSFINIRKSFINIKKSFVNIKKCSFCPLLAFHKFDIKYEHSRNVKTLTLLKCP